VPDIQRRAAGLLGKTGIANSCVAYRHFQTLIGGERFGKLAALGARPQRVLWASTSTKNPKYRDTYYVEELIGPHTINTMPPETLAFFRDHGRVRSSLEENAADAETLLDRLGALGISLAAVTQQLEEEGVKLFDDAFNKLLKALEEKARVAAH
jgi:transaldolase